MLDVSAWVSAVVASAPAAARVEMTGLSMMTMLGAAPCWAASSVLVVSAVVSKPVRLTSAPAETPHFSTSLVQSAFWSYCGYGSHRTNFWSGPLGAEVVATAELAAPEVAGVPEVGAAPEPVVGAAPPAEVAAAAAALVVGAAAEVSLALLPELLPQPVTARAVARTMPVDTCRRL